MTVSDRQTIEDFRYTCALFAIIVVGTGLGGMTQTALNTVAVVVLDDLGADIGWGQWITTLYIFSMGAVVPLASFLQKRFSVKSLMSASFVLYLLGSFCDFIAMDFAMLLVGRVLEALSTGVLMPLLQTVAMTRFPENRHGTAMGVAGIALGFAPNMGPVAGGAICEAVGWRTIFLILLIASILLLAATLLVVRDHDASDPGRRLDWQSLALSTFGFGGILLGFTSAANMGLGEPLVWLSVLVGIIAICAFIMRQKKIDIPLVNLKVFQYRDYTHAMAVQCALYGCFVGMTLVIPLVIIDGVGATSFEAGLVLFPGALAALVFEPGAGAASDKFGVRKVAIFGGIFLAAGAIGIAFVPMDAPLYMFALFQTLRCVGLTTLIPSTTAWGLGPLGKNGLTPDGSSGLIMMRQIFAALATAVMIFLLKLFEGLGQTASGFHAALGFSGLLGLIVLVLVIAFVKSTQQNDLSAEKEPSEKGGVL